MGILDKKPPRLSFGMLQTHQYFDTAPDAPFIFDPYEDDVVWPFAGELSRRPVVVCTSPKLTQALNEHRVSVNCGPHAIAVTAFPGVSGVPIFRRGELVQRLLWAENVECESRGPERKLIVVVCDSEAETRITSDDHGNSFLKVSRHELELSASDDVFKAATLAIFLCRGRVWDAPALRFIAHDVRVLYSELPGYGVSRMYAGRLGMEILDVLNGGGHQLVNDLDQLSAGVAAGKALRADRRFDPQQCQAYLRLLSGYSDNNE